MPHNHDGTYTTKIFTRVQQQQQQQQQPNSNVRKPVQLLQKSQQNDQPLGGSDKKQSDSFFQPKKDPHFNNSRNSSVTVNGHANRVHNSNHNNTLDTSEDTKISKLIRKLQSEYTDQESFVIYCRKLLEVIILPFNTSYIYRSFDILMSSLMDAFNNSLSEDCKFELSRVIGRFAYVIRSDYKRFLNWFSLTYNEDFDYSIYLIASFKELILVRHYCVSNNCSDIDDIISITVNKLLTILELTEDLETFIAIVEVLIIINENFTKKFANHFRDTVDIIIGWHADENQPEYIQEFASKSLQSFRNYWKLNIDFSMNLIQQIIEDLDNYFYREKNYEKFKVLFRAFNTLLKCFQTYNQSDNSMVLDQNFLFDCLSRILKMADVLFKEFDLQEDLMITLNESIYLIAKNLKLKSTFVKDKLLDLIKMQLNFVNLVGENGTVSIILMIAIVVKVLSVNLPVELVDHLMGPNSLLYKNRFLTKRIRESCVFLCTTLLDFKKNISVLYEVYRYVLGELEVAYATFVPGVSILQPVECQNPFSGVEYNEYDAREVILYLLQSLSQLVNTGNSIIGMWALNPSLLRLLSFHLIPFDERLTEAVSIVQYAIIDLLFAHIKCNGYFISTSNLLMSEQSMSIVTLNSTTANNLSMVFSTVICLCDSEWIANETVALILKWILDLVAALKIHFAVLLQHEAWVAILNAIISKGHTNNENIALLVCECLKIISRSCSANYQKSSIKRRMLIEINELCQLHICSNNDKIKEAYIHLLTLIPLSSIIDSLSTVTVLSEAKVKHKKHSYSYNHYDIVFNKHCLMTYKNQSSHITPNQLTDFLNLILNKSVNQQIKNDTLLNLFSNHGLLLVSNTNYNLNNYRELALNSKSFLSFWFTWESAQFLVNQKLKTNFGKAADTFTAIENCLRAYATDINDRKFDRNHDQLIHLLNFLENLEKLLYNAIQGCAIALTPADKPIITFFTTNTSKCREWLSRIRLLIIKLAIYGGCSTIALRHCEFSLQDLLRTNSSGAVTLINSENGNVNGNGNETILEIVFYMAVVYVNLNEPAALMGLYYWLKSTFKITYMTYLIVLSKITSNNIEIAYDFFISFIKKSQKNFSQSLENYYLLNQSVEGLKSVQNWSELVYLETEFENFTSQSVEMQNTFLTSIDSHKGQEMLDLENGLFKNYLNVWSANSCYNDTESWNIHDLKSNLESELFKLSLKFDNSKEKTAYLKDLSRNCLSDIVQKMYLATPLDHSGDFLILQRVVKKCLDLDLDEESDPFNDEVNVKSTRLLSKMFYWKQLFNENFNSTFSLRLDLIKVARKQMNFNFAEKLVVGYFQKMFNQPFSNMEMLIDNLTEYKTKNKLFWSTYENYEMLYETGKLLYENKNYDLALNLASMSFMKIFSECHNNTLQVRKDDRSRLIGGKLLLKIAKWLHNYDISILSSDHSMISHVVKLMPDLSVHPKALMSMSSTEIAIGKLLSFNLDFNADYAKVWSTFGTWCYKWGSRVVSYTMPNVTSESVLQEIRHVLDGHFIHYNDDNLQQIANILTCKKSSSSSTSTNDHDVNDHDFSGTDGLMEQLRAVDFLHKKTNLILDLIEVGKEFHKNEYCFLELAAKSYFSFLEMHSQNALNSHEVLTATLRLLRLIVRHALELQTVLDAGLAATPTKPWKAIIPQLFARLNHPEIYIRKRVGDLLCRIAVTDPHLIMFPVVVGAMVDGDKIDITIEEGEENVSQCHSKDNVLSSCFQTMVDTLETQSPELIKQAQQLVRELRRISLLWDELWLATLSHHYSELQSRIQKLEVEVEKVQSNQNLKESEKTEIIAEKHRIIMKPIIFILEQLKTLTFAEPETENERQFQKMFKKPINDTLDKLRNPENPDQPQESWRSLHTLYSKFRAKAKNRKSFTLKMSEISPVLASLRETKISMPGLSKSVSIRYVDNHVTILPTKTQPKKLLFKGSDGLKYYFLLKGSEDLHLDERIMQFLAIANTMMAKHSIGRGLYKARYYSVIPLGLRSGLISWVDGTIPLFALYKSWQKRQYEKVIAPANSIITKPMSNENEVFHFAEEVSKPVIKYSELFYQKLNPLLEKAGLKNSENRQEWPLAILKQVLTDLMNETPKDLLSKEMWCYSVDSGMWWQMVKNYSYSLAVMSVIGYIIGLGDRHLDNVLIDLSNGEVVHIDYNVCFEKGKKLRIPEKVPFRMTANLKHALGITGVEGTFRSACEHTLSVLRDGSETLLTLLEAFIYDPLVDWTVDAELLTTGSMIKKSKQEMDKEVTWAMFNVRCTEIRADWFANKNQILKDIGEVIIQTKKWQLDLKNLIVLEEELQDSHEQLALIKEAESQPKHKLYSLPSRFVDFKRSEIPDKPIMEILQEKHQNFTQELSSYEKTVTKLKSDEFREYIEHLEDLSNENYQFVSASLSKSGLTKALKNKFDRYATLETDFESLLKGQVFAIKSSLDFIKKYSEIANLYPVNCVKNHRKIVYNNLIECLLEQNGLNSENIVAVINESLVKFKVKSVKDSEYKNVIGFLKNLQNIHDGFTKSIDMISERKALEGFSNESLKQYEDSFQESKRVLLNFMKNDDKSPAKSFELVMILSICSINKRIIRMEMAASSSGNCLVDLKTKEGSWFFDDMLFSNNLLSEVASFLQTNYQSCATNSEANMLFKSMELVNNVYRHLKNLHDNFLTIILPEAIKAIQMKNYSIFSMIQDIKDVCFCSIDDLLVQLEKHLQFTIMEMDSPFAKSQQIASKLGLDYRNLLHKHNECNSSGQMLFIAFNGLFRSLQDEFQKMIDAIKILKTPTSWKQIDQFKDIETFMSSILLNDEIRQIMNDIFLLKRLKTIVEFFSVCEEMWLKSETETMFYVTDDQFIKPVKSYIADFISKKLLGLTPLVTAKTIATFLQQIGYQHVFQDIEQRDLVTLDHNKIQLEDLCKKAIDYAVKQGIFSNNILAQTYSFCSNFETTWKRKEIIKVLNNCLDTLNVKAKRLENSLQAYYWLFEDYLVLNSEMYKKLPRKLPNFLKELINISDILQTNQLSAIDIQTKMSKLDNDIKKIEFSNKVSIKKVLESNESVLKSQNQLVSIIRNVCNDIINYEQYRIQSDVASELDDVINNLLESLRKSATTDQLDVKITRVEENLMLLLPTDVIDQLWLKKASGLLSNFITSKNQEINVLNEMIFLNQQNLIMNARNLKDSFDVHRNLMHDVYDLLKSMSKSLDYSPENAIRTYLNEYQEFVKNFASISTQLSTLKSNKDDLDDLLRKLCSVQDQVAFIYDALLEFEGNFCPKNRVDNVNHNSVLIWDGGDNNHSGSDGGNNGCKIDENSGRKGGGQRKVQQQNAYAISVWNRVKMKLEGRDPDPGQRSSVSEQVSFVIREATNLDNLALLYEGWTPWV